MPMAAGVCGKRSARELVEDLRDAVALLARERGEDGRELAARLVLLAGRERGEAEREARVGVLGVERDRGAQQLERQVGPVHLEPELAERGEPRLEVGL